MRKSVHPPKEAQRKMIPIQITPTALLPGGGETGLDSEVTRSERNGFVLYDVSCILAESTPQPVKWIRLFEFDLGAAEVEVFRQGFYMPSDPCGFTVLKAGEEAPSDLGRWDPPGLAVTDFLSHTVALAHVPATQAGMLFGFTTGTRYEGLLIFDTSGPTVVVRAWCNLEGTHLYPGRPVQLEQLMVMDATDVNQALRAYAEHTGRVSHARVPRRTLTGWSDWQYYRHHKTEQDIHRNVKALETLKEKGIPLTYIVIDNGFCKHMSEWLEPSDTFPSGMAALGRFVRQHGFELGVWLAPYIANENTRVVKEHPEWLVRDGQTGEPLFHPSTNVGPAYVLDFTHPGAVAWLRGIVRVMVREWGARYLKLDGPRPRHHEGGRFHQPDMTGIQMIRKSLEVIREECEACTEDDVVIEGEGIYGPSIGIVDIQRTTQDNWPFWYFPMTGKPGMKANMKNDLLSGFLHGRLWHNHRENVILRDFPSPIHTFSRRHPDSKDIVIPDHEVQFQISTFAMVGGAMLLTDPMDQLLRNPRAERLIASFLPPYEGDPCEPLDIFRGGGVPCLYLKRIHTAFEEWFVLAVFNWEDGYRDVHVPASDLPEHGPWHAFEFWTETYLGKTAQGLAVRNVPAHTCRLIALRRPTDKPQLVGTNLHVFQGAVEFGDVKATESQLRFRVIHPVQNDASLFVTAPPDLTLHRVETDAADYLVDDRRPGITEVRFNGKADTHLALHWEAAGS